MNYAHRSPDTAEDETMRRRIGDQVRVLRQRQHISQAELARRIGMRPGPMNNIEQGRHVPSGRVLIRLADALGVSVDELLGRPPATPGLLREPSTPYLVSAPPAAASIPHANAVTLSDDPPHDADLRAQLNEWIDCFLDLEDLCGAQKRAVVPLTCPFHTDTAGMELLAQQVRLFLGIGQGVIFDYLELLENAGLRIIFLPLPDTIYSAAYYDAVNANAILFIHTHMNAERQIFELIKRLGSIYFFTRQHRLRMCGHSPDPADLTDALEESRAVRKFTAFFLMPEDAVRMSVAQLGVRPSEWSYPLVLRLKHRFGVSAQSFVYRLRELDLITDTLADAYRKKIEAHYARTDYAEPDDSRRILSPNGRIGDLYTIAKDKKQAAPYLKKYRHLFEPCTATQSKGNKK